jgi:hypothetical protein
MSGVVIDTREMEWERMGQWDEFAGLRGGAQKVLLRDEQGLPLIDLSYLPAGFLVPELPYRHYHSTVHEFMFGIWGELPHWEYESADAPGTLYTRRSGHFMHRLPGSIHGMEANQPSTKVGACGLEWRTGTGVLMNDPGWDEETIHVDYPADWKPQPGQESVSTTRQGEAMIIDWGDLKKLDTNAMTW